MYLHFVTKLTFHPVIFSVQNVLSLFCSPFLALQFPFPIYLCVKPFQNFHDEAELRMLSFPPIQ